MKTGAWILDSGTQLVRALVVTAPEGGTLARTIAFPARSTGGVSGFWSGLGCGGDETVIDAGCGSGRLTAVLLARLPRGQVIAVDQSAAMLAEARSNLQAFGNRVHYVCADVPALKLVQPADVVFSTATFHWIGDHDRLFHAMAAALVPGGKLEAQYGGGPNLSRLRTRVQRLLHNAPYAAYFGGWREPWRFCWPDEAASQLRRAGFGDVTTTLEPAPITFSSPEVYRDFLQNVVLWPHLSRLPRSLRAGFVAPLVEQAAHDEQPLELDYWRLNVSGTRLGNSSSRPRGA